MTTGIRKGRALTKAKGDKLRLSTMLLLTRFTNAVRRWEVIELRKIASRPTTLDVLNALLAHSGTMSHSALTKWTFHTSHGLTAMIDTLERKGLVKREPSSTDRRSVNLSITEEGTQYIVARVIPHAREMSQRLLSCLSDEEVKTFHSLLRRVREHLREQIDNPPIGHDR